MIEYLILTTAPNYWEQVRPDGEQYCIIAVKNPETGTPLFLTEIDDYDECIQTYVVLSNEFAEYRVDMSLQIVLRDGRLEIMGRAFGL